MGELRICNLDLVNDREEAERASLIEKPNLKRLELIWSDSSDGDNNHEQVLDGLQPHQYIKSLIINNFTGDHFPTWTMKMTVNCDQVRLDNLTEIKLINCNRCREIPTLGTLPLLEILHLEKIRSLRSIEPSFYDNIPLNGSSSNNNQRSSSPTVFFPALKSLRLVDLPSLVGWVGPDEINAIAFPVLTYLKLDNCAGLISLKFPHSKCLKTLELWGCEILSSISFSNGLTSLKSMDIRECGSLTSLPCEMLDNCISLEEIFLRNCRELSPFSVERMVCLTSLTITHSPNLKVLPKGIGFGRLTELRLGPITEEEFVEEPLDGLQHSLQKLTLYGSNSPLPYQIQHLTCLKRLELDSFGIEALPEWLGNLSSLQELRLWFCKKLKHFPSKQVMQLHLIKLKTLQINFCPLLSERCNPQLTDSEWPKISHIPEFYVDCCRFNRPTV